MTPTNSRKRLYSFFIEPGQLAALKALQVRDGIRPSESIRRAIDLWVGRKGIKKGARAKASRKTGHPAGRHPHERP